MHSFFLMTFIANINCGRNLFDTETVQTPSHAGAVAFETSTLITCAVSKYVHTFTSSIVYSKNK